MMHGLGMAALVTAAVAFAIARKPAPQEADLTWHEGRILRAEVMAKSSTDERHPSIIFSVLGLKRAFEHERAKPGYDTLLAELTKGASIAVLYDPTAERRWTRAWGVKKGGRTLLTYDAMKAWDTDNKVFGFGLAAAMGGLGLILMVFGFQSGRKSDESPG